VLLDNGGAHHVQGSQQHDQQLDGLYFHSCSTQSAGGCMHHFTGMIFGMRNKLIHFGINQYRSQMNEHNDTNAVLCDVSSEKGINLLDQWNSSLDICPLCCRA